MPIPLIVGQMENGLVLSAAPNDSVVVNAQANDKPKVRCCMMLGCCHISTTYLNQDMLPSQVKELENLKYLVHYLFFKPMICLRA